MNGVVVRTLWGKVLAKAFPAGLGQESRHPATNLGCLRAVAEAWGFLRLAEGSGPCSLGSEEPPQRVLSR